MSKKDDKRRRSKYTLEFKLEAVRLVKGGRDAAVSARILATPKPRWTTGSGDLARAGHDADRRAGRRGPNETRAALLKQLPARTG